MKKFIIVLSAFLSILVTVIACGAPPKPLAATHESDASVHHAPRLGANFFEAGVSTGTVGDSGLLTFTLVTPLATRFPDEQLVTAIEVRSIYMDLVAGTVTAGVGSIGGDPQQVRYVVINLPAAQEISFVNSLKAQIAAQLNVTFQ